MREFFYDITALGRYAPGVDNSIDIETLQPSFLTAKQRIVDMITPGVWDKIDKIRTDELIDSFLSAIANRVMFEHSIFLAVSKNSGDQKLYKYQHEEIKDKYISNFWSAMNNILTYLDQHPDYAGWQDSTHYKQRQGLLIKSAEEFDYYYAIESSPYFFYKIQFLIRKIYENDILPRIKKIEVLADQPELAERVKRALCYHVMAEAVATFDLTELPRSIRYDFNHEYTKTGSMTQSREKLQDYFLSQVRTWYKSIETDLALMRGAVDIEVTENKEQNPYFFMS